MALDGPENRVIPTLRPFTASKISLYAGEVPEQLYLDRRHHAGQFSAQSGYDFNDDSLSLGATYWVKLVERFLARPAV